MGRRPSLEEEEVEDPPLADLNGNEALFHQEQPAPPLVNPVRAHDPWVAAVPLTEEELEDTWPDPPRRGLDEH